MSTEALIQRETDIFAAIQSKDAKTLDEILSDDFVYRNPAQAEQTKEDFLKAIESLPLEIVAIWSEDLKVNVYSEVAVLTGIQKARVRLADGEEVIGLTAFTDIFVKTTGQWLLVLAHGVELPPTAVAPESTITA